MSTLLVDLDLASRGATRETRLHVGYAVRETRVARLVRAGGRPAELGVLDLDRWADDLAAHLDTPVPPGPGEPPARVLELPWALMVGTGAALARHRPEVYDELVARDAGALRADGVALTHPAGREQLRRLHHGVLARLQLTGTGARGGRLLLGKATWLRFADGWRELTPYLDRAPGGIRRAMVRVEPRRPSDLAARVACWAVAVRR